MNDTVLVFADGGSTGTTNKSGEGGWGVLIIFPTHKGQAGELVPYTNIECSGHKSNVTNNQMELQAVITALSQITHRVSHIVVIVDSAYVCNGMKQKWYEKWEQNGWLTSKKEPVANKELWQELIHLYRRLTNIGITIEFQHINSHITSPKMKHAYHKFCKKNGDIDFQTFQKYVQYNERVDQLADEGIKRCDNQLVIQYRN